MARFLGRLYSRADSFEAVVLDLAGERGVLVRMGDRPHVLTLELDAGQVVGVRLVTNPDKLTVAVAGATPSGLLSGEE